MMTELGGQIAANLGDAWHVDNKTEQAGSNRVAIRCPSRGEEFGFSLYHNAKNKRISVHPWWPHAKTDRTEFPHYSKRPDLTITMGDRKNAAQVAQEIQRRFLPAYKQAFGEAVGERDEYDRWMQQCESNRQHLSSLLNAPICNESVHPHMGDKGYIPYIQVASDTVQFEFRSLPIDLAVEILTLWRDRQAKALGAR